MSDYEKINTRVKQQVFSRKREALVRIIRLLAVTIGVIGAFYFLWAIGFISGVFMVILTAITVCFGAFKSGWICRDIFR